MPQGADRRDAPGAGIPQRGEPFRRHSPDCEDRNSDCDHLREPLEATTGLSRVRLRLENGSSHQIVDPFVPRGPRLLHRMDRQADPAVAQNLPGIPRGQIPGTELDAVSPTYPSQSRVAVRNRGRLRRASEGVDPIDCPELIGRACSRQADHDADGWPGRGDGRRANREIVCRDDGRIGHREHSGQRPHRRQASRSPGPIGLPRSHSAARIRLLPDGWTSPMVTAPVPAATVSAGVRLSTVPGAPLPETACGR